MAETTTVDRDLWVTDELVVGTTSSPTARFDVVAGAETEAAFQLSAVDDTPLFVVYPDGDVGLSTSPTENLDISGVADIGDIGMQLRSGNLYPRTSSYQITFGYAGKAQYRHAIRTRHSNSVENNSVDFLLWTLASGSDSDIGDLEVLSLVSSGTATSASMHINPVGTAQFELVVSSGPNTGGGTMMRALEKNPSSRDIKADIVYLGEQEERKAFDEAKTLRHVSFRYKGGGGSRRGILYEDAPESVRRPGKTISRNARVTNAEMALKELMRRLEASESRSSNLAEDTDP
ncbi:hypothetical protein ACFL2T_00755 [Elusimicrobiota bacterium]